MKILAISILLMIVSCSNKPKSVLICGDHVCVNKNEAKQYFEENLTLEVKILNDEASEDADLIELNLRNINNQKKISFRKKQNTTKEMKTLTPKEIEKIKKKVEKKKNENKDSKKIKDSIEVKSKANVNNINKKVKSNDDICTLLKECSIDEISKYLIKEGKKKKTPDITIRQ